MKKKTNIKMKDLNSGYFRKKVRETLLKINLNNSESVKKGKDGNNNG